MSKLPRNCHWKSVVKVLEKFGFEFSNVKPGSHYAMIKIDCDPPIIVTIPMRNPLKVGTLSGIIAHAGLTRKDFFKYYKK